MVRKVAGECGPDGRLAHNHMCGRIDMASSRFTNSRSLRRMRLRSVAVPFFLVTVKPTRIGPSSSRRRLCTTKAALPARAPLATARKSAPLP